MVANIIDCPRSVLRIFPSVLLVEAVFSCFHVVFCALTAHGWIHSESFLDGDVLLDCEAEQKAALFCTEEMGVPPGKFGWSDWENERGVPMLERRGPPKGAPCSTVVRQLRRSDSVEEAQVCVYFFEMFCFFVLLKMPFLCGHVKSPLNVMITTNPSIKSCFYFAWQPYIKYVLYTVYCILY